MKIKDSVVLVTGGNRGLGLALVQELLRAGAKKVYACSRTPDGDPPAGAQAVQLDVTDVDSIQTAAAACSDVTMVINNAGVVVGTSFLSSSIEAARAEIETNYIGPLQISRAFSPILSANGGGVIVNVLSVLSWINVPDFATYSASKAAAWSLTNGLRGELRSQGTHVMAVHVGYMDTDMVKHIEAPKMSPRAVANLILDAVEREQDELLADEFSRQVKSSLSQ